MGDSRLKETTQVIPINNKNLFQGDVLCEPFKRLPYFFLILFPQVSNYLKVEK